MIMDQPTAESYVKPLLAIALAQTLVTLAAGLNLYLPRTGVVLSPALAVRWRELLSLTVIMPMSTVLLFLAQRRVEGGRRDNVGPVCLILLGFCWLGISMGVHEPINALWCPAVLHVDAANASMSLRNVLEFWDDVFSHILFFAGYVAVSLALLWSQKRNVLEAPMGKAVTTGFVLCAVPGGAGIYYSLVGTRNTIDMTIIVGMLIAAEIMRGGKAFRRRPLNILQEVSYLLVLVLLLLADR